MDVEREYNAIQEDVSSELRWAQNNSILCLLC